MMDSDDDMLYTVPTHENYALPHAGIWLAVILQCI